MFMPKLNKGIPPKARVLIVGGPPFDELTIVARNLCTLMNAHLCATHYVGSLTSLTEYDAYASYQGEMIIVTYAHNYKYQVTDERKFDMVFYISQPNLGIVGRENEEEMKARLSEHVFYVTLQSVSDNVFVLHNTTRDFNDLATRMLDKLTYVWPTYCQKEPVVEPEPKTVLVGHVPYRNNMALIARQVMQLAEVAEMSKNTYGLHAPNAKDVTPFTNSGENRNRVCYCGSGKKYKKCCLLTRG